MKDAWLTIHELAAALKVSVKTVRRAYLTGEIPSERIFRFVRFDVDQVKEAMRKKAQKEFIERRRARGGGAPGGESRRRAPQHAPGR